MKFSKSNLPARKKPDSDLHRVVGRRIKEARKALNMSLDDVAGCAGLSVAQLSKLENGKASPTVTSLIKLGSELKRPVAYFLQTDNQIPRCLGTLVPRRDTEGAAIERFAELVKAKTEGDLSIAVLSASQLGTATGQVEGLVNGLIDIFVESLGFFGSYADLARVISIPFCFEDEEHYQRFQSSDLFERELRQVLRTQSVELMGPHWNWRRGPTLVILSKRPIYSPEDLRGLAVRSTENEVFTRYLEMLGAHPVVVPWSDVYDDFANGKFEAMFTNLSHVVSMRFTRIARHVTQLNYRPLDLSFAMNLQRYQMLVPSIQAALDDAALMAGQYCGELLDSTLQEIHRLVEEDNAVVCRVPVRPWRMNRRGSSQRSNKRDIGKLVCSTRFQPLVKMSDERGDHNLSPIRAVAERLVADWLFRPEHGEYAGGRSGHLHTRFRPAMLQAAGSATGDGAPSPDIAGFRPQSHTPPNALAMSFTGKQFAPRSE
ncbi:TRAP transporter substrate-binding protein DctP [Bradyrhizobium sp. SRL28]|uniref:TRAP transporter substrate-binding protein DctP n=1 Tax=Bradyrhizobium sp. SRL28 TaxID=2836178 RepID=UPI001BDE6D6D|nr:TRAP transporter substrate-binding protein DctP [Bradyrhizobium sp. SRL28]MBT1517373.1 TRAP transporter substrate-binding protein DctP [Bradyrhizobium sp. SRL28]